MKRSFVVFVVIAAVPIGLADSGSAERPDPADPSVPGPALRYESAFEGYRDVRDRKQATWKDANEEVGRLGGHAGHAGSPAPVHNADRHPTSPRPSSPGGEESPAPSGHGADHGK